MRLGGANGPVGLAGAIDRAVQGLGDTPVGGFGRLQRIERLSAAGRDQGRGGLQRGVPLVRFDLPSGQVFDAVGGVAGAFGPAGALRRDHPPPVPPRRLFPHQRIAFRARRGFPRTRGREGGPRFLHRGAQGGDVGQRGMHLACSAQGGVGLIAFGGDPRDLFIGRGQSNRDGRGLVSKSGQGGARAFQPLFQVAPQGPRLLFRGGGLLRGGFGLGARLARPHRILFRGGQPRAQSRQTVALLQAHRGLGGRSGANGVAIPPPDGPGA